jgi:hypothetical protein
MKTGATITMLDLSLNSHREAQAGPDANFTVAFPTESHADITRLPLDLCHWYHHTYAMQYMDIHKELTVFYTIKSVYPK